jgi:hypothetical protein
MGWSITIRVFVYVSIKLTTSIDELKKSLIDLNRIVVKSSLIKPNVDQSSRDIDIPDAEKDVVFVGIDIKTLSYKGRDIEDIAISDDMIEMFKRLQVDASQLHFCISSKVEGLTKTKKRRRDSDDE